MDDFRQTLKQEQKNEGRRPGPALPEQQRRELWLYIVVSIVAVELLITVGALFFGFMGARVDESGQHVFSFPWLSWTAFTVIAPTLILLLAHSADVGLFRPPGDKSEEEWQKHLPERMQKIYRIIKGAPVVAVLGAVAVFGAGLLTLEGAISAVRRFGSALVPHIPYIVGGIAAVLAVIIVAAVWLNFRTRRLIAEYEFRREVLEKTGVIIVDKGSTPLPPGGVGDVPYAIVAGEEERLGLPPGDDENEKEAV